MLPRFTQLALTLALLLSSPAFAGEWQVTLKGNGVEFKNTPVSLPLKDSELEPGSYVLKPVDNNDGVIAAQIVRDAEGNQQTLTMVIPSLGAQETASYHLVPMQGNQNGVSISLDGQNFRVEIDGELFTVYRADDAPKPYFFPVIGPTGVPITRAYPMNDVEGEDRDHPHQRSFWFTHGDVNGVDFWASDPLNRPNPRFGTIQQIDQPRVVDGPVVGILETKNAWKSTGGQVLCTDHRIWRTYAMDGQRIVDFDLTISAEDSPVTFGDTKEGSFGLRLASSMNVNKQTGGRIINAEGITNTDAWGKASPWVDYTGPIGDETLGVAILNHPESFRFPTTWHVRDYGLFAANPFGYRDFNFAESGSHTIAPGESITLRYRVILHAEDTDEADIATAFQAYTHQPIVEITCSE